MDESRRLLERQSFVIKTLRPYITGEEKTGYDPETGNCKYITTDGRMCALGKWLKEPAFFRVVNQSAACILKFKNQAALLKEEAVDKLTAEEWSLVQRVHDEWAMGNYAGAVVCLVALEREIGSLSPLITLMNKHLTTKADV